MAGYFAVFLVVITLLSGLIWLIDAKVFAPSRRERVATAVASGVELPQEELDKIAPQPAIAETAQSIFPILAAITIFRSFLFEPFQIPSGSMMPTMLVGDFILVQKYSYGVHDPVWRSELVATGEPKRGDIAVFKYPLDERLDYIKRVIGLPGDRIVYRNKQLAIQPSCDREPENCKKLMPVELEAKEQGAFVHMGMPLITANEQLGDVNHEILVNPAIPDMADRFYQQPGTRASEWIVPDGKYFMMGDNRDNSTDSRFWGFVDEEQLVGKAVFIWMSFVYNDGQVSWLPNWVPVDIRFSRLGTVQ
ncbi:signal peptidase I [Psychrosphaera sp. B3R10]|uniref:signal peptidase I n=1 Tax=unclassified Psychrosphaera TaxID=2641570 RepID=UPI001C09BA1E|nr:MULTISPECIES: signal peptidase I [unclassified Psychrosphaera]MBU2882965.1 signal peptidase I [Psychrosphaera sp. I2R16]MBU2991362.1 signal peptidase I [Psychrosphaera sp. B3R10]